MYAANVIWSKPMFVVVVVKSTEKSSVLHVLLSGVCLLVADTAIPQLLLIPS